MDEFRPQQRSTVAKSLIKNKINARIDRTFAVGQEPDNEVDV